MVGEGTIEIEDQSGGFIPISNYNIDAMKKYQLYAERLQRGVN